MAGGPNKSTVAGDIEHCRSLLKAHANDLYLATLLAPQTHVEPLIVLRAYHAEMLKIVRNTDEPLAGEIRLRWWADVFSGLRSGEAASQPLFRALQGTLTERKMPFQPLFAKAEAHIAELYSDPFPDRTSLEGHLGETHSTQFYTAASLCGADQNRTLADASGHAGVAIGITDLLLATAFHRSQSRVSLPLDVFVDAGLTTDQFISEVDERHCEAIVAMVELARHHRREAIGYVAELPSEICKVFKPLALLPVYLALVEANPQQVITTGIGHVSQIRRQWALWRG